MATFYNQATLSFGGTLTNSNITTGELIDALSASKTAVSASYGSDDGIAYAISIVNTGTTDLSGLTVTDDLGASTLGTVTVTPLTYIDGTVKYYQNGTLQTAPTAVAGPPLTIGGISVPAGGNVLIVYEARVNSFADMSVGSTITNTATVSGDGANLSVSASVPVKEETKLSITKCSSPDEVSYNGELTYTFIIQNTGNTEASADDSVTVTDTFDPILSPITVSYNGTAWTAGTEYTYDTASGIFSTIAGQITVPAATYSRNTETGVITVTPGTAVIKVTGNV